MKDSEHSTPGGPTAPDPRDANREHGRSLFLTQLLERSPGSVLDVGCGRGELLRHLRHRGVRTVGVEPGNRPHPTRWAHGPVVRAAAERLPFLDASFEWVSLRHVLHHVTDPAAAVREAARVARLGVFAAEPWFDPGQPAQACAQELEFEVRALERAAGRHHAPNLDPDRIAELCRNAGIEPEEARCWHSPYEVPAGILLKDWEHLADAVPASSRPASQPAAYEAERLYPAPGTALVVALCRPT